MALVTQRWIALETARIMYNIMRPPREWCVEIHEDVVRAETVVDVAGVVVTIPWGSADALSAEPVSARHAWIAHHLVLPQLLPNGF